MLSTVARLSLLMPVCAALPVCAAEIEIGPLDDVRTTANALVPGDVLILRGGTYDLTGTSQFNLNISGTALSPITIRAKAGETPEIYRGDAAQNLVNIFGSFLVIDGVNFRGGSAGVRLQDVDDFTLRHSEISQTEAVGLRASDTGITYSRLLIEYNNIHDTGGTGEGMYLGCNSALCSVEDSTVRGNWVHHTNGMTVTQGDGIEVKEGGANNWIIDNVIHDTGYPCILVDSSLDSGRPNRIERNAMWNCGDYGIQIVENAAVSNNIVLASVSGGISAQPHGSASPGNLRISHNTVVQTGVDALRLTSVAGSVQVFNNALYSQALRMVYASGDLGGLLAAGNVGEGTQVGVASGFDAIGSPTTDFVDFDYADSSPGDVFPKPAGSLIGAAHLASMDADDFNGDARAGSQTSGAYRYAVDGNPGWALAPNFKPLGQIFRNGFE